MQKKLSRLKSKLGYIRAKLNDKDLSFFSKYSVEEEVYPQNTDKYHLEQAIKHLKSSFYSTGGRGFASKYDYVSGKFGPLYPEVTGYILNTLYGLKKIKLKGLDISWVDQAIEKSVTSLMDVQLADGGYTGGHKHMQNYGKSSIFNTGQILLGLSEHYQETNDLKVASSLTRAVNFMNLNATTEGYSEGFCYNNRFSSYYSRAAYGHIKAGKAIGDIKAEESAVKISNAILKRSNPDGSIDEWGFKDKWHPLHTVIYTLRGLFEVGYEARDERFILSAVAGLDWLKDFGPKIQVGSKIVANGDLYMNTTNIELCFTGLAQQVILAQKLHKIGYFVDEKFNIHDPISLLKGHQLVGCEQPNICGSLPGCKPLNGAYQPLSSPVWAVKFFIDALLQKINQDFEVQG